MEKTALRHCLMRYALRVNAVEKLCLWNGRTLFIGSVPDLGFHSQAAALICVGLTHEFELAREGSAAIVCRSALIGPQVWHTLKVNGGLCAFLFVDPDNPDYEYLLESNTTHVDGGFVAGLKEEGTLLLACNAVARAADDATLGHALEALELSRDSKHQPVVTDERIRYVIRLLAEDPGDSIPIETLAAQVDISPSRLAHLFKEQVGVPIRMFRTWFRLKTAVILLKDGLSITEAALRAGFYDSAHFANTFRDTFGLSPSMVFSPQRQIAWYIRV